MPVTLVGNFFCLFGSPINKGGSALMPLPRYFFVIRLGLEPKTPTLKVLCSTS